MPSHGKKTQKTQAGADNPPVPSKNMDPFPENFFPIFIQNQFRTKIELPTKARYPNVPGKCAIITGSNIGLGFESAKQLLSLGLSHLVMGVRSLEKGRTAAVELQKANPSARIEVWSLDMDSYDSIQAFARKCQENLSRIDIAILNAGMSPLHFATIPATGHERTMQVNHFGTALLAVLLLPVLKSKSDGIHPPHLTVVNSLTANLAKFPNRSKRPLLASFDDVLITPWDPQERYASSKLMSQLFLVRLADKVDANKVIINLVEPGLTKGTGLARDATGVLRLGMKAFFSLAGRPVDRAAATYVDAALGQGKASHGCFVMNCKIAPLASWYYSDGEELSNIVWDETLQDLSFSHLEEIIASL